MLLSALSRLRPGTWSADVVTQEPDLPPLPTGVTVHRGLTAGSAPLRALFAAADVFVLPTSGDASPFAVMEAMAAGLAVISTRVGAIPEMVSPGRTGILTEVGDAEALVAGLARLAADRALCRRMGEAGRRAAEVRYDSARNYPALLETLKRAAAGGRRPDPTASPASRRRWS